MQEDTMKLSDFLEEAAIMKEMKHPNLVQVRFFPLVNLLIFTHYPPLGLELLSLLEVVCFFCDAFS